GGVTGNTASGNGDINDVVTMPAGSSIIYVVTATVDNNATGTIANTAQVNPPTGVTDVNMANNTSTQSNVVGQAADLGVTKTDNVTSVTPGQAVDYDITVTNNGPAAVVGATVTDAFPAALTNVTFTSQVVTGVVSGNTASGSGSLNETVDM